MARACMKKREEKREKLAKKYEAKRKSLLLVARDKTANPEEIFKANLELAKLPRNSSPQRQRNRCEITGRPRGYYRKFRMSRIALRELGNQGKLPGLKKASW